MSKPGCARCKGTGTITRKGILGTTETHPCPRCDGTGDSRRKDVGGNPRSKHPAPPPGMPKELKNRSPHE